MRSGAGYLFASRLAVAAANWVGTVVIVRHLTPADWGRYSFVFALLGIIGFAVDLRIGRIVLREVLDAGREAGEVVGTYIALRLAIALTAYALAAGVVIAGGYERSVVLGTLVAGLGFLFITPANGYQVLFQARIWLRPVAVSTVLGGVAQLALVLLVAFSDRATLVQFAAASVVGQAIILLWRLLVLARHHVPLVLRVHPARWWLWFKEALPLAVGTALVTVYYRVDIVMLESLDTTEAVGQYSIGYKFADIATFASWALLMPVTTLMVAAWPHDRPALQRHFRQSFTLLTLAALAIGVGFALVAHPLIVLLYSGTYSPSANAARLLVAGAVVQFFSYLCFSTLVAVGRSLPYTVAGVTGLLINVVLNFVLIPAYSFDGSAVATVFTEVVALAILLLALRRTPGIVSIPWNALARGSVAALAMASVYLGIDRILPWPVAAVAAALAFVGGVHVLRVDGPGGLPALLRNARFEAGAADAARPGS